ncbi:MAG: NADH-quinone oxidoreductase subunit J [Gammaproteobacteria bacterium]
MIEQSIFYIFAGLLVFAAVMVITIRNPVHAALFLILSFFTSAGIWLLLGAEFLAIVLVLVYVGAVMVLFLFVIMMLDINLVPLREGFARFLPVGALVALLMMVAMGIMVGSGYFRAGKLVAQAPQIQEPGNTSVLGQALYIHYLYPFEIAGVILLVAIIAAIALTMRKPRSTKAQRPGEQVLARKQDRLKIIKMDAEKRET